MKADNIIKELKVTGILLFMVLAVAALYMGSIAQAAEPAQLRTIAFAVISVWVCAGIIICLRINSRSKDDGCWSQKDLALLESWYRRCICFQPAAFFLILCRSGRLLRGAIKHYRHFVCKIA